MKNMNIIQTIYQVGKFWRFNYSQCKGEHHKKGSFNPVSFCGEKIEIINTLKPIIII